jgi:hypothetical protein
MSAHADDLRYFYAEVLGRMNQVTGSAGASVRSAALEPGRYMVRVVDWAGGTDIWVRQGGSTVVAAASAPSTRFIVPPVLGLVNEPVFYMHVRGTSPGVTTAAAAASADDYLAVWAVGGNVLVQITKISRGRA